MNIQKINNSIKRTAWVVPLAFVLLTTGLYFTTINSDVYGVAVTEVRQNNEILTKLGEVTEISLNPFRYRISTLGGSGNARFNLKVKGSIAKATIQAYLIREKGIWRLDKIEVSE